MVEEHEGHPFSVREFVEGSTVEHIAIEHSIDLRAGLEIIANVARIVQWVHGRGFVHRNLPAANVLVASNGVAKLIGFGRVKPLADFDPSRKTNADAALEIDIQGLQEMLAWLFRTLGARVPKALQNLQRPGSVRSPSEFADAIRDYVVE
jgi:serine/threonine protein kinase